MKDRATTEKYNQEFREIVPRVKKELDKFVLLIETAEAKRMIEEVAFLEKALPAATESKAVSERLL